LGKQHKAKIIESWETPLFCLSEFISDSIYFINRKERKGLGEEGLA